MLAALLLAITVTRSYDPDGFVCLKISGISPIAQGVTITQVPPTWWASWNPFGADTFVAPLGFVPQPSFPYRARECVGKCTEDVNAGWVQETNPIATQPGAVTPPSCKDLGVQR